MEDAKNTNLSFLNPKRIYKELGKIQDIEDHIELKEKKEYILLFLQEKNSFIPKENHK